LTNPDTSRDAQLKRALSKRFAHGERKFFFELRAWEGLQNYSSRGEFYRHFASCLKLNHRTWHVPDSKNNVIKVKMHGFDL
jgi:hypothetical protein